MLDLHSKILDVLPLSVQFSSFHAVLGKFWGNSGSAAANSDISTRSL